MNDVLTRLAASDPLQGAEPPAQLDEIATAILASPRPPAAKAPAPWRGRAVVGVAAVLVLGTASAGATGVGWDTILPGSDSSSSHPRPLVDVAGMEHEATVVRAAVADPPGRTTPAIDLNPVGDTGSGELGAGASGQLLLKMCTWQRAVLDARAAGDAGAERRAREVLARDYWYRYYATPADSAAVRSWNTDPAKVADLQQAWDVNCPGGAYDPATHPGAPPIGR